MSHGAVPEGVRALGQAVRRWAASDAAYALLDGDGATRGGTWFQGGCGALAAALVRWSEGRASLAAVATRKGHEHYLARFGPWFVDADGARSARGVERTWCRRERLEDARVVEDVVFEAGGGMVCPAHLVGRITRALRASLGEPARYLTGGPYKPPQLFIGLRPRPTQARVIALAGTEGPSDLHVTLAFFGRVDRLPVDHLRRALAAARACARRHAAFRANLGRRRRFTHETEDVIYLPIEGGRVVDLREDLVRSCAAEGLVADTRFPFVAHMTLGRCPRGARWRKPPNALSGVDFEDLWVCVGHDLHRVPLEA